MYSNSKSCSSKCSALKKPFLTKGPLVSVVPGAATSFAMVLPLGQCMLSSLQSSQMESCSIFPAWHTQSAKDDAPKRRVVREAAQGIHEV